MNSIKSQHYLNQEQWKYTKIDSFKNYNFNYKPLNNSLNNRQCKNHEILLHNGHFIQSGKTINKNKIIVYNIKDALNKKIKHLETLFNNIIPKYNDLYTKHNKENFFTGYYLYIPKNLQLNEPIIINNINDDGDKQSFTNYRNFIFCDQNTNVKILNKDSSEITACNNIINEIYINNNSELEVITESNKPKTKQIYNFSANINQNAKLKYHALDFKGKFIKNNYYFNLNKPGAECAFNGFNIAQSKNYIDNYIEISHNHKHTKSQLDYKIISSDNAKSILFAKAIIKKNSSNCEAYQNNHNLILSEKATIHSNPQLEIYNDDVQCSHGSTTGQIDDEIIHYMRTRGINIDNAKKLILEGFLQDITNNISIKLFRNQLNNKIAEYLQNENF